MSVRNVQFTVSTHIAAVLGYHYGGVVTSAVLAQSVNAEPSFVRRSVAKLSKAGLIVATRGKHGACSLARSPETISLLEIYRASEAPAAFSVHSYPVEHACPISAHFQDCMAEVLDDAQSGFEQRLAGRTLAEVVADIKQMEKTPP